MTCPICGGSEFKEFSKCPQYKICIRCNLYQQDPLPEKTYEGPEENFGMGPGTGHLMSEADKKVNRALAESLYGTFHPKSVLDIGSKYPYLLSILKDRCSVLGVDAISEVLKYGLDLHVPTLKLDIEDQELLSGNCYDLITLIHVIEHFHKPITTIERILSHLSPQGTLFIRTPDPEVPGIERDLTAHHLTIHPYLFTRKSLDNLLLQFGYRNIRQDRIDGYGQSDYYVQKIATSDTISLCMIVKNEERNIEDCLKSIKDYVDEIIIVDTGSEDKTKEVVSKYTDKIYDFPWTDDFSAARNYSLSKATLPNVLWCDADDIFQNPSGIKKLLSEEYDVFNFNILYGNDIFCHARLFRNFRGVHFKGRVHEYPVVHHLRMKEHTDINVLHKTVKHSTENRTLRNVRILKKEIEQDPNNSRTLFYLANSLRELGNYDEAIETYHKYLALPTCKDERFLAQKYIGRIREYQKQYKESIEEFLKAIAIDDRWAEAYYYIGENYFYLGQYEMCIRWMMFAASMPVPSSLWWKEMAIYRDLPYRYIFACYDTLKNYPMALEACRKAIERSPGDKWLLNRVAYFESRMKPQMVIECFRQGAIGDCLMTTAALRGLKEKYPGCWIRYITHPKSMSILEGNKYIDELVTESKGSDLQVYFAYPESEGYPHKPLGRHLVRIFNECAEVDGGMELECTLNDEELAFGEKIRSEQGRYVSLHIQAGWSPYKEWYDDRWEAVVEELFRRGYPVLQIGWEKDRLLKNTVDMRGLLIKKSVAIIKNAVLHIGVDSFSNHAAHAVKTPAVILFGSTSPIGSGYEGNENIWCGLECSPCYKEYEWARDPNGPCPYDRKCMKEITVEEVLKRVLKLN